MWIVEWNKQQIDTWLVINYQVVKKNNFILFIYDWLSICNL